MDAREFRGLFLLDPTVVFLNHGSFGARPREVVDAQASVRAEMEAEPVEFLGRRSGALVASALAELARAFGSAPEDLAFVENATTGVSVAASSLPLGTGDEVLGTDHEYGACARAWERIAASRGAAYRRVRVPLPYRGDDDFMARFEAAIGPRTRAVFASHVTSPTALRFPVERLCRLAREKGLYSVVDGAHAPGQLPLDLESIGADFYAGNCHKWLCGPLGSGFLRVERGLHASVEPPVSSWGLVAESEGTGEHDAYAGRATLARRLQWLGTRDLSAFLAVPAAIRFSERAEPAGGRCRALASEIAQRAAALLGLEPVPEAAPGLRMALVPLPPCDGAALKARLFDSYRVEVPVIEFGGSKFLRVSCHVYNDGSDAEALLGALGELFPGGRAERGARIGG